MKPLNDIGIWIFSKHGQLEPITLEEIEISKKMSPTRAEEYKKSRGYTRKVLSNIFEVHPLEIPLNALPGKPPELIGDKGFISLSHCKDAILVGWSSKKIGIDIERKDRKADFNNLINKYYFEEEIKTINNLNYENQKLEFLKYWVLKEAAIKWHRGNIASDIKDWEILINNNKALNKHLSFSLNTYFYDFKFWFIGIANDNENNLKVNNPIFCTDLFI